MKLSGPAPNNDEKNNIAIGDIAPMNMTKIVSLTKGL